MARFFNPFNQFFNGSGRLLPNAKLFFYENGTTTLQDTFSDAALTTPNTNPVICNGDGRVPEIFMGDSTVYSVTLTDTNDVQIAQIDDYTGADSDVSSANVISALNANTQPVVVNGTGIDLNAPTNVTASGSDFRPLSYRRDIAVGGSGNLFHGALKNSANEWVNYSTISTSVITNTDGAEVGRLELFTISGGTELTSAIRIEAGDVTCMNDLSVTGALSKGSGAFKIDHPLMPDSHYLVHSFVESPRAENLYSGMVDLVNGTAQVNLDSHSGMSEGTYEALNHTRSWSSSNETGYSAVKCSVSGNILTIECEDSASNDTVYFEVRGERKDQHMFDTNWTDDNGRVIVEPQKDTLSDSENQQ